MSGTKANKLHYSSVYFIKFEKGKGTGPWVCYLVFVLGSGSVTGKEGTDLHSFYFRLFRLYYKSVYLGVEMLGRESQVPRRRR